MLGVADLKEADQRSAVDDALKGDGLGRPSLLALEAAGWISPGTASRKLADLERTTGSRATLPAGATTAPMDALAHATDVDEASVVLFVSAGRSTRGAPASPTCVPPIKLVAGTSLVACSPHSSPLPLGQSHW